MGLRMPKAGFLPHIQRYSLTLLDTPLVEPSQRPHHLSRGIRRLHARFSI